MNNEFPFEEGDRVLVRVRENGKSGRMVAKFVADCEEIRSRAPGMSLVAELNPPWTQIGTVDLHPYEAEFEKIEQDEVPNF